MSKAKMERARDLIKEKRYDEARMILEKVNHPTAEKWLAKLEEISPRTSEKNTRKKLSCFTLGIIGFALVFTIGAVIILLDPRAKTSTSPLATKDIVPTLLAANPPIVDIKDVDNTGLPENFLRSLVSEVSVYGDVDYYHAEVIRPKRLLVDLEIKLTQTRSNRTFALNAIERILRLYETETDSLTAGSITILISWNRNSYECADNAGMGYKVMSNIDWQHITQAELFSAIDKNIYQETENKNYADIGWSPDKSGIEDCNF